MRPARLPGGWLDSPAPWSVWGRRHLLHDRSEAVSLLTRFLGQLPLTAHNASDFCPFLPSTSSVAWTSPTKPPLRGVSSGAHVALPTCALWAVLSLSHLCAGDWHTVGARSACQTRCGLRQELVQQTVEWKSKRVQVKKTRLKLEKVLFVGVSSGTRN